MINKQIIIGTVTVLVSSADACDDDSVILSENTSLMTVTDSDVIVSLSSSR